MGKGSTTQKTSQTSNPPAWALPLLQKVAGEAMNFYNSGEGYNVYRGPTVAQYSPQKLEGLNRILTMTGGGTPVTNEAVFGNKNPQVAAANALIQQQIKDQNARKVAAALAAQQAAKKPATQPMGQRMYDEHGNLLPPGMAGYYRLGYASQGGGGGRGGSYGGGNR